MRFLAGVAALISLFLVSCETISTSAFTSTFTSEKVMKIHQGMTSEEIVELFGEPRSISTGICGAAHGQSWTCTTWNYGDFPSLHNNASFTFQGEHGHYRLNDFRIYR